MPDAPGPIIPPMIGVPIKLLHEAEGHIVTVEMRNGDVYRGLMIDAEDNMSAQMQDVTCTSRTGEETKLQYVYIRGSQVRFMLMPDMLKNAPMFKRFDPKAKVPKPQGLGMGFDGRGFGAQDNFRRNRRN